MTRTISVYFNQPKSDQKTWTQLVGPYQRGDEIDGRLWVRPTGTNRYRILWTFETPEQAEACFSEWKRGS